MPETADAHAAHLHLQTTGNLFRWAPSLLRTVWGSGFPENAAMATAVEAAAQVRSLPTLSRKVIQLNDLTPAFDEAAKFGATALIFLTDNLLFGHRREIAELALSHHLPSIHSFPPEVQDGALMSYGPDPEEEYQRAAACGPYTQGRIAS